MRLRDSNYLNMALAVQKILSGHAEEVENRNVLPKKVDDMTKCIEAIQYHQAEAEEDSKGATQSKKNVAEEAVELALMLAGSAVEYAKEAKDAVKEAQFDVSLRDFNSVPGVVAVARLMELVKNLKAVSTALQEWDVTEAEIRELDTLTGQFNSQLADPREIIVIRKSHNDMVRQELSRLKKIIKSIDNLMSRFKDTKFLMEYVNARIVVEVGTRKGGKDKDDKPEGDEPKEL
ncbi:hypothetical protein F0919_08150 [Taibaiella lutea]|uniref:Uncharacterized protein n=1 Tax=Taibaiella lutea TaxID=2608001 RepID=A0A5M6CHU5_9BACT|nr:hypothetical protein [Taibaiella lutea]KAA5534583.1 hypothetical protein F0919_08150 [Taibaiella lutea]